MKNKSQVNSNNLSCSLVILWCIEDDDNNMRAGKGDEEKASAVAAMPRMDAVTNVMESFMWLIVV